MNEVRELKINKGYILVSYAYDVSCLFTNVPLDETITILTEKAFRDDWFNSTFNLNISKEDLTDLLNVSTKGQLFQFNGALYEQTDGVATGSPFGPLLANFLNTLNHAHPSASFTMEIEKDGMLPFLGTQLLNRAPQIETKVYVKPTNTGLLVHYQSHVVNRYKRSFLTTMLDRTYRLSSSWLYLSEECERLKSLFSRLDYPHNIINSTINTFINSRVVDQQPLQASGRLAGNDVTRVDIPVKDQDSTNIVKTRLKDLSIKLQTTIQPIVCQSEHWPRP